jgi:holin-like protein
MLEFALGASFIVAIFFLGDFLHRLGVPIPGGVLGLLLLYAGLQRGLVKLEWVERAAGFLLRHMVLFFIPLTVGLIDVGALLSHQVWIICISLVLSFLAVLLLTGLLGDWLLKSVDGGSEAHES